MLGSKKSIKSIAAHVAASAGVKRVFTKYCHGFATVFVLQRASGVYDGIHGHNPQEIEKLLLTIKKHRFKIVSVQDIVSAARGEVDLPNQSVAFTIDGGYSDQIEVLAPIFVKLDIPLTIFLTTGLMDGELWPWDAKIHWLIHQTKKTSIKLRLEGFHKIFMLGTWGERKSCIRELQDRYASFSEPKAEQLLRVLEKEVEVHLTDKPPKIFSPASWDSLRDLEGGGISFAPHTHSKRILARLTPDQVCFELEQSLDIIKKKTWFGLPVVAYPSGKSGHFGLREILIARELGFSSAFAVSNRYTRWRQAKDFYGLRYNLGRFEMPHSVSEVLWLLTGTSYCYNKLAPKFKLILNKPFSLVNRRDGKQVSFFIDKKDLLSIETKRINRLIFVCRGNISRSPYAEAFANGMGFSAISCGVDVNFSAPAETMGSLVAFMRGKDLSGHQSSSIYDIDVRKDDCLVAMDWSHLPACKDIASRTGCQVTLMGLWRSPVIDEIDDPYGKDLETFQNCYDLIEESMKGLADFIRQRSAKVNPTKTWKNHDKKN